MSKSDSSTPRAPKPARTTFRALRTLARIATHTTAAGLVVATLYVVGQPIYANDTWIHLALGEAFAKNGPWLASDPHLFTASGPPAPSSWLGALALFEIQDRFGFQGLRLFHAVFTAMILGLAWSVLRKLSHSRAMASALLVAFIVLATYRLVQLRPDLFSIAAVLALFPLVWARADGPSLRAGLGAAGLSFVWANVHPAFLLGPLLVLGTSFVCFCESRWRVGGKHGPHVALRARRLAMTGLAMLATSLFNPRGIRAHTAYMAAGHDTAGLTMVSDEWGRTNLLAWPVPTLPPTFAAWIVVWLCLAGFIACTLLALMARDQVDAADPPSHLDWVRISLAGAGIAAAIAATRFLWLGVFALGVTGALLARSRAKDSARALQASLIAAFAIAATWAHVQFGDWPIVSRSVRAVTSDYSAAYPAEKYFGHAIWFLADSGVEGRIYNDYSLGGFMSFWLAPRIQMASSGTMNASKQAMDANLAIAARSALRAYESYAALLDRQGLDLFLGVGLPIEAFAGRPIPSTVRNLEGVPGWIAIFRNPKSAVYLRNNERNAANLERVRDYYARSGVPFDPAKGFEPAVAIRSARDWSIQHGLIPSDYEVILDTVRRQADHDQVTPLTRRLAMLYATLGLYEPALEIEHSILRIDPKNAFAPRRIVWNLLQMRRLEEAIAFAEGVERTSGGSTRQARDTLSQQLRALLEIPRDELDAFIAQLPLLEGWDVGRIQAGLVPAPVRTMGPEA